MPALCSQGTAQEPKWCLLYTVRADTCLHLHDTSRHRWLKPVNSSLKKALLLLHMCVHAVSGWTCMWRQRDNLKRHASGTVHLLRVILTGLKLINQAWLEGQQVLRQPVSTFLLLGLQRMLQFQHFAQGFWGLNSGHHVCLSTKLSSQPERDIITMTPASLSLRVTREIYL